MLAAAAPACRAGPAGPWRAGRAMRAAKGVTSPGATVQADCRCQRGAWGALGRIIGKPPPRACACARVVAETVNAPQCAPRQRLCLARGATVTVSPSTCADHGRLGRKVAGHNLQYTSIKNLRSPCHSLLAIAPVTQTAAHYPPSSIKRLYYSNLCGIASCHQLRIRCRGNTRVRKRWQLFRRPIDPPKHPVTRRQGPACARARCNTPAA